MRQMRILFRRKRVSRSCKSVLRKRSRHRYCLMKSPIRRLTCQSQPTLNRPSTWKSRPFRLRGGQRPSIERRNRPRSGRPTLTPASPVAQHSIVVVGTGRIVRRLGSGPVRRQGRSPAESLQLDGGRQCDARPPHAPHSVVRRRTVRCSYSGKKSPHLETARSRVRPATVQRYGRRGRRQ